MTPEEARQLIGIERTTSETEVEELFRQRFQEMESKIERAPTPSLKEKYRRNLAQLEEAWEVLSAGNGHSAEDNFPSLHPVAEESGDLATPVTTTPVPTPDSPESAKSASGWLIGLLVFLLCGGAAAGWYFGIEKPAEDKKIRDAQIAQQEAIEKEKEAEAQEAADTAQKAQLEAQAKAAADEAARLKAQADRKAADEAAAAKAKADADAKAAAAAATAQAAAEQKAKNEAAKEASWPKEGQEWTNSLGMKFVPAGTSNVLMAVYDTRVEDWRVFVNADNYQQPGGISVIKVVSNGSNDYTSYWEIDPNANWEEPGFNQAPDHPVIGISWNDAKAFCHWLTNKERWAGRLGPSQNYRLPTDAEWSVAVGNNIYPWGEQWPPPTGAGNYADEAKDANLPGSQWHHLHGNDGYEWTSPVGSFQANSYGLYDMGGNVWQWCEDWYTKEMNSDDAIKAVPSFANDGGGRVYRVLRGASWNNGDSIGLRSSFRNIQKPDYRDTDSGFRCVVVVSSQQGG